MMNLPVDLFMLTLLITIVSFYMLSYDPFLSYVNEIRIHENIQLLQHKDIGEFRVQMTNFLLLYE